MQTCCRALTLPTQWCTWRDKELVLGIRSHPWEGLCCTWQVKFSPSLSLHDASRRYMLLLGNSRCNHPLTYKYQRPINGLTFSIFSGTTTRHSNSFHIYITPLHILFDLTTSIFSYPYHHHWYPLKHIIKSLSCKDMAQWYEAMMVAEEELVIERFTAPSELFPLIIVIDNITNIIL